MERWSIVSITSMVPSHLRINCNDRRDRYPLLFLSICLSRIYPFSIIYQSIISTSFAFSDKGTVFQPVSIPDNINPHFGNVEIITSSTALQELVGAVLSLVRYKYECSEQVFSSLSVHPFIQTSKSIGYFLKLISIFF